MNLASSALLAVVLPLRDLFFTQFPVTMSVLFEIGGPHTSNMVTGPASVLIVLIASI